MYQNMNIDTNSTKANWKNIFSLIGIVSLVVSVITIASVSNNQNTDTRSRAAEISKGGSKELSLLNNEFAKAVKINNSIQGVKIINSSSLNITNRSFTIEAWIYPDPNTNIPQTSVISKKNQYDIVVSSERTNNYYSKSIGFLISNSGHNCQQNGIYYSYGHTGDEGWMHIAGVVNGNYIRIFLNGRLVSTASIPPGISCANNSNLTIGLNQFVGLVDEVRLSNTARYVHNFVAYYKPIISDINTIALYHLDENAVDASSNGNNGNLIGSPNFVQSTIPSIPPLPTPTPQSIYGNAIFLQPSVGNPFLSVYPIDGALGLGNTFTIEGWYKTPVNFNPNVFGTIIGSVTGQGQNSTLHLLRSGYYPGKMSLFMSDSSNTSYSIQNGPTTLQSDRWYYLTVTKENGILKMYVDGHLEGSTAMAAAPRTLSSFFIGAYQYNGSLSNYLDGQLDEIRISSVARYHGDFTPPGVPFTDDLSTLILYHFDEQPGTNIFEDSSLNTQNAVPINNVQVVSSTVPVTLPLPSITPLPTQPPTPTLAPTATPTPSNN